MNDEAKTRNGPEASDERLHHSDLPVGERPCLVARGQSRIQPDRSAGTHCPLPCAVATLVTNVRGHGRQGSP